MEKKGFVVKFGEKEVDISKALPLTFGDFRKLKRDFGIDTKKLIENDLETQFQFLLYVTRKVDSTLTEEDLESMPMYKATDFVLYMAESFGMRDEEEVPS